MWHVDHLLGNDREISSNTTAVSKYWPCKQRLFGRAIVQAASRWLPTAAARVRSWVWCNRPEVAAVQGT
jgi:hypothetical protein